MVVELCSKYPINDVFILISLIDEADNDIYMCIGVFR